MPDYDINQLGARPFEQLVVSLSVKILGPGIEAFGDGPDGGREATYDGTITWSAPGSATPDVWSGYTVVQAKFHYNQSTPADNAAWLVTELKKELDRWVESIGNRKRKRPPQYLIIATNVRLSAAAGAGGIDTVNNYLRERLGNKKHDWHSLGIRAFRIWHNTTINHYIDNAPEVRYAYPGLLTVGDVLAKLGDNTSGAPDLGEAMRLHAAQRLRNERWIRLSEAGATSGQKAKLDEVGTDLPGTYGDRSAEKDVAAVAHIISHGDAVLRQNLLDRVKRPHWVIIGGPGQGKTTVSALLAQIYRARLLFNGPMSTDVAAIVEATTESAARRSIPRPRNVRWPMRIDLAEYAETLASEPDTSLLAYLSREISNRTDQTVAAGALHSWLRTWPWIVLLDGLDEVSSTATRRTLMNRITDFQETADSLGADLLLVATTRPLGYDERFDSDLFTEITLRRLTTTQALRFGTELVATRLVDDPELKTIVLQRLNEAAKEPRTARLMETPLQVTIMSFIVESSRHLPPDRYGLFELYYRTIYKRETDKPAPIARVLNEHPSDINWLHEQVGLTLHIGSEETATDASLPLTELDRLARERLSTQGYNQSAIDTISTEIVRAATHRLVLLVPEADRVHFEVRSLQELMAALAISSGPESQAIRRLELTAHHPHWRNVWLLAAGRLFKEREHLQPAIVEAVRLSDDNLPSSRLAPMAPLLAYDVLDDGYATRAPNTRRPYLQMALTVLDIHPSYRRNELSTTLARVCVDEDDKRFVFDRLTDALTSTGIRPINAYLVLRDLSNPGNHVTRNRANYLLAQHHIPESTAQAITEWNSTTSDRRQPYCSGGTGQPLSIRDALAARLLARDSFSLSPEQAAKLLGALEAFADIRIYEDETYGDKTISVDRTAAIPLGPLQALDDPELETALALLLDEFADEFWPIVATVQEALRPVIARRAIGQRILALP